MPAGDRTGPRGNGPMSGRAMGNCGRPVENSSNGEFGQGLGRGRLGGNRGFNQEQGQGQGQGQGQRMRNQNFAPGFGRRRGPF